MKLRAMAKINLGLDVVKKREDGYHEVRMIMQTIHMYDQIELHKSDIVGIHIKTNLPYLPTGENNLVYRAAKLLMDEYHRSGYQSCKIYPCCSRSRRGKLRCCGGSCRSESDVWPWSFPKTIGR